MTEQRTTWPDAAVCLAFLVGWFGGIAIAPAGWATVGAFLFPPYALMLTCGRLLAALGLFGAGC